MSTHRYSAAVRLDKGELTSQGFLRAPAYLTRTGVFNYRKADGSVVRELRHPDDVFHPDSLASLQMAPLTDDHPEDFVTPDNVKELSIGWIGETVVADGDLISASAIVADKKAIQKVNTGKVELSCGYMSVMVPESGTYNGEHYDCRQTKIRYNHVAIVGKGRAGRHVRLRLDSEDAILDDGTNINLDTESTVKLKIDGKEVEVTQEVFDAHVAKLKKDSDDAVAAAVAAAKKDASDAAKKKAEEEEAAKKKLKEDVDALQAKNDQLTEKLSQHNDASSDEKIAAGVKARMAVEKTAVAVLGKEFKLDGVSNTDLMKAVIAKQSPKTDLKERSQAYVQARFDAITEDIESREDRREQLKGGKPEDKKDGEPNAEEARKRNADAAKEQYKEPLASTKK